MATLKGIEPSSLRRQRSRLTRCVQGHLISSCNIVYYLCTVKYYFIKYYLVIWTGLEPVFTTPITYTAFVVQFGYQTINKIILYSHYLYILSQLHKEIYLFLGMFVV